MNFNVIDDSPYSSKGFFKLVFKRKSVLKNEISLFFWIKLTFIEFIFGSELIENILNTGSWSENKDYGKPLHLNRIIPSGFFINIFRGSILNLLYYKYWKQYILIQPKVCCPIHNKTRNIIDCTCYQFQSNKKLFGQLISFRRTYEFGWLCFNLFVDIIVYLSMNFYAAIMSALVIEGLRRLLKI